MSLGRRGNRWRRHGVSELVPSRFARGLHVRQPVRLFVVTLAAAAVFCVGPALAVDAEPGLGAVHLFDRGDAGLPQGGTDLSCPTISTCTSILPSTGPQGPTDASTLAEPVSEADGVWGQPTPIAPPASTTGTELVAVSCAAPGDCTAGGDATWIPSSGGGVQREPIVVTETDGTWGPAVVLPVEGIVRAVECSQPGDCVVLGSDGSQPWVSSESAGSWSTPTLLPLPSAPDLLFVSLSLACPDQADCTVMSATDQDRPIDPDELTYVWAEHSGTWGQPEALVPGALTTNPGFVGQALACSTSTQCLAVGSWEGALPAYAAEVNGAWRQAHPMSLPHLSPTPSIGWFSSISCASATTCVAVEKYYGLAPGSIGGAVVTFSHGMWSSGDLIRPPVTGDVLVGAISCPSSTACLVDGESGITWSSTGAENTYGPDFAELVTPVRPVTRPGPPMDVTARAAGPGEITVRWSPPTDDGGAQVSSYTVTVAGTTLHCVTGATRCTIGQLDPSRSYELRVTDTTAGGTSRPTSSAPTRPGG